MGIFLIYFRAKLGLKSTVLSNLFSYVSNGFTTIGTSIVVVTGSLLVTKGKMSLGELLVFVTYMSYFYDPIQKPYWGIGVNASNINQINPAA